MGWFRKAQAFVGRLASKRVADDLADCHDRLTQINALAADLRASSDEDLRQVAQPLRSRVLAGVALNDIAAQVFALVREVADRTIGWRSSMRGPRPGWGRINSGRRCPPRAQRRCSSHNFIHASDVAPRSV